MNARHIFIVILMVYISVLNIALVHAFFGKYLKISNTFQPLAFVDRDMKPSSKKHVKLPATPHVKPACSDTATKDRIVMALVPGVMDVAINNDINSHRGVKIMSEVRQAFRYNTFVSTTKPHAVLLFVTMHSFFSIHRTWCNSFASTTQFKASCTLVLLPDTPSHKNVFTEVLTREPCTHNLLLLSDKAKIGSSFFTRLKGTPSNKVTCLAATDNPTRCPIDAFRLPHAFMLAWNARNLPSNASIVDEAISMQMYGGSSTVVGVA